MQIKDFLHLFQWGAVLLALFPICPLITAKMCLLLEVLIWLTFRFNTKVATNLLMAQRPLIDLYFLSCKLLNAKWWGLIPWIWGDSACKFTEGKERELLCNSEIKDNLACKVHAGFCVSFDKIFLLQIIWPDWLSLYPVSILVQHKTVWSWLHYEVKNEKQGRTGLIPLVQFCSYSFFLPFQALRYIYIVFPRVILGFHTGEGSTHYLSM